MVEVSIASTITKLVLVVAVNSITFATIIVVIVLQHSILTIHSSHIVFVGSRIKHFGDCFQEVRLLFLLYLLAQEQSANNETSTR